MPSAQVEGDTEHRDVLSPSRASVLAVLIAAVDKTTIWLSSKSWITLRKSPPSSFHSDPSLQNSSQFISVYWSLLFIPPGYLDHLHSHQSSKAVEAVDLHGRAFRLGQGGRLRPGAAAANDPSVETAHGCATFARNRCIPRLYQEVLCFAFALVLLEFLIFEPHSIPCPPSLHVRILNPLPHHPPETCSSPVSSPAATCQRALAPITLCVRLLFLFFAALAFLFSLFSCRERESHVSTCSRSPQRAAKLVHEQFEREVPRDFPRLVYTYSIESTMSSKVEFIYEAAEDIVLERPLLED